MTITQDTFVAIKYTLKNKDGQIIDSSTDEPLEFTAGRGFLIAGLEKELEGKKAGDKFSAVIPPAEAYGEYSGEPPWYVRLEGCCVWQALFDPVSMRLA